MGEKEDKEKAEKVAAAKKRLAQLKKKKAAGGDKAAGSSSKKSKDATKPAEKEDTEDAPLSPTKVDPEDAEAVEELDPTVEVKGPDLTEESKQETQDAEPAEEDDPDTAAFNEAIRSASRAEDEEERNNSLSPPPMAISPSGEPPTGRRHPGRQASVSLQPKIRSASFRHGATPTSPAEGDDFPDIYRKQMARIEELEKENKRLAKEAQESQSRWQKNEDELEELRENAAEDNNPGNNEEVHKLRSEIDTLRRNSKQSNSAPKTRADEDVETLRKDLEGKDSTISDMQLEISRLRSQVTSLTTSGKDENEQVAALQDSLQRAEASNTKLSTELTDVKKALNRASEKAVLEGTERTSKDTKIKSLERELEELKTTKEDLDKKAETLEKKIDAMSKLHRESDQRNAPKLASADAALKELQLTKAKLESSEKENLKLREARKHTISGDGGEEGLEEIEDEERQKLQQQIRQLESENFDLRRGVWRDRRKDMQPNLSTDRDGLADEFDEVDLNGSNSAGATRRGSTMQPQAKHSGFAQVINSGLAAFRASTTSPDPLAQRSQTRPRNDSLLEEFDDDAFDESAFAAAQREEEMRKMVEHVREVKKGLKQWKGWRLDLVDLRRGGGSGVGFGEVFGV